MERNGGLPILGQQKQKAGVGTIGALIRDLDENGEYDPEAIVANQNGQAVAIAGRHNIVTAEDLCEMMVESLRPVIREEVRAILDKK